VTFSRLAPRRVHRLLRAWSRGYNLIVSDTFSQTMPGAGTPSLPTRPHSALINARWHRVDFPRTAYRQCDKKAWVSWGPNIWFQRTAHLAHYVFYCKVSSYADLGTERNDASERPQPPTRFDLRRPCIECSACLSYTPGAPPIVSLTAIWTPQRSLR
jgi:hypothetical protein